MVTPMMFQSMITPKSLYPSIDQQFQGISNNELSDINPFNLKSHITSDGNFCWYTKDNEIFFYELNTGKRITTWCFVKESKELMVTSVGELFIEDSMFLVATIKYDNNKTFLKVLDPQSGDVIRTVDIGSSNVNYIKQIYRESLHSTPRDSMRNIKTPLALGFQNSCQIIIIDLYFNPKDKSIESSSKIQQLILQDLSNYNYKQFYNQNNNQNNINKLIPYFILGCDQFEPNVLFEYPISKNGESQGILVNGLGTTQQTLKNNQDQPTQQQNNCQISSIYYIDSIQAIAVGYSIGTFQLYSSVNFKLYYCSPLRESTSFAPSPNHQQSPVTHILYQELDEDDQSPIGNLWIGRGSMNQDSTTHQISIILYKLIFDQITPDPSKSLINLISIDQNFDLPLNLIYSNQQQQSQQQQQQNYYPGEILSLDYLYQNNDINTEKGLIPKSKSIITYQYIGNDGYPKIEMKLFDLELLERFGISQTNKQAWIHNIELIKSNLNTSFHSFWLDQDSVSYNTLYQVDNNNNNSNNKLNSYDNSKFSINHPNFKVKLLTFNSIDSVDYLNPQERLVKELSDKGAIIFEHPQATYQRFIDTQIFSTTSSSSSNLTDKQKQKNDLMIFSLNNNLLSIITDYILNYKSSNAKLILDLFWNYFERIQSQFNANELFSKVTSSETQKQFENVYVKVVDLVRIFRSLIDRYIIEQNQNNNSTLSSSSSSSMDTTIDSISSSSSSSSTTTTLIPDNLKKKLDQAINMALFIEVLKWCMNFDLFGPLNLRGMENVRTLTIQKRKLLSERLSSQLGGPSGKNNIQDKLLIDLFYDTIDNIDHSVNYYPPSSSSGLKSFIQIFSTSNQFKKKLAVLFYLLIDLETVSSEVKNIHSSDTLKSFLGSFKITNKYYSFIMGIWKLDNYLINNSSDGGSSSNSGPINYEEINSSFTLLNSSSITKKFIYPILSRFYSFGFNNYAQLLMKGLGFEPKTFDEASIYIKVLLSNDAILESILFQRSFRSRYPDLPLKSIESLLFLIFKLALDSKKLELIIDMPLDETEEQVFIQYLFINKASSLISIFYIKRGRIPEACKINRNHSIATSRNIGDMFEGYDTINHLLLNYEQSLPSIQKPLNFYTVNQQQPQQQQQQQQQSIDNQDIPLLPRSVSNNFKSQFNNNNNNNNSSTILPPQSFIQKPLISTLQVPKLYNESIYFSSNLSTSPISNLEALTKKSEDDKKEKMEIQQRLYQMEEQKRKEAQDEIKRKEKAIQDELRKQREAEEYRKQELERQRKLEVERVKQIQQEQLQYQLQQQQEQLYQLQQQQQQQQQQQTPQSPILSSNSNSSPISSPSILKSALKSTPSSSSSSKKSARVTFKDTLNQTYEIPALVKKSRGYDDDDDDDDDDDEDMYEDDDDDFDEDNYLEEDDEDDTQQKQYIKQQQQRAIQQQEEDEEDEDYEDIYNVDDDDMIIHEDNDQESQYTQYMKQQQQQQQLQTEADQDLSDEGDDQEYDNDDEYDENEEDPFKDFKRPEHGGKEPPKFTQFSMLSKPKSQFKQSKEDEEQEEEEEEYQNDDSVEYDEDDRQQSKQQDSDQEEDEEYEEDDNKLLVPNISDGFGTEDKPMEILSSEDENEEAEYEEEEEEDEEAEPPTSKGKRVVAHRPAELDDQEEQPSDYDEDNESQDNNSDESSGEDNPTTQKSTKKSLESSIEFDQDDDY